MAPAGAVMDSSAPTTPTPLSSRARRFVIVPRRKQRCWIFRVGGITRDVSKVDLLASICKRYTTVKRLVVKSEFSAWGAAEAHPAADRNVEVEVEFTGPLPSEGPGALLCNSLCGSSVEAKPVELPRGRKKRPRTDEASSEATDSDVDEGRWTKISCLRSTNSQQQVGKDKEEEEDSPGGGRLTSAKPISNCHGGSPMNRAEDHPGAVWRTSVRDGGGTVASKSGLTPLSLTGLFSTSSISSQLEIPSISHVVAPSEPRTTPELMPPVQPRVLSLDTAQQQEQHMSVMHQQHQYRNELQKQQQQTKPSSAAQRDDVVGCVSTPQGLSNSLEVGNVDLPSSGHPVVENEFDYLLLSPSSGGMWGANDSGSTLFDPISPPTPVQRPIRGKSFDSSQTREPVGGDSNSANMVMDLFDIDNLLHSTKAERTAAAGEKSTGSVRSAGSNSAPGVESWHEQGIYHTLSLATEGMLPMEKVVIEPSPKECDFEGRPPPTSSPRSTTLIIPDGQCHMVFTGLEKTGHDFRNLRVTAHFGVDSVHKVGEGTGSIKMNEDGRAIATVCYPSMREIWPELYCTGNVQVVQVDVVVEIRSDCGKYQYVGPQLKIAYHRTLATGAEAPIPEPEPLTQGRQIPSGALTAYTGLNPQASGSCDDYSCFDRLSDMCHAVSRGGGAAQHPLPDDPIDLMSLHP